ncbi:MAG: type I-U CRISPR-associated helicase/endonuclease Cas3 [Gammaproteobacteria bacterium]|nr:type I-U CRISPR-associated helicase/endonuclease Cas3 [Gammaproteobacteria bacterium]
MTETAQSGDGGKDWGHGQDLPSLPSFREFYRAINGREPFPWQARLAELVATEERWRGEIGVPTGLGKTACLDIAVWWLASQATRPASRRTAPTRIWWVVNRRLLVDSTADHARRMADKLRDPAAGVEDADRPIVARVAERLRSLWVEPNAAPLDVICLRGGIASGSPTDPARPTIVLCTVPMYGSRLLFRGYGSRRRSVDAAMAGTDSLVLLDEAHLAPHLKALIPALGECHPTAKGFLGGGRARPQLVALTATGDSGASERFDLDGTDEAHPVVRERLDAVKPVRLVVGRAGDAAKYLAQAALELVGGSPRPVTCLVFANSPRTARTTFELLREARSIADADTVLLTGLAREREAGRIRGRILDPDAGMAAGRHANVRCRHLVVVATQTLEVGADVDAECLVTEGCGVRALTQRLGRLNRLGRFPHAKATYVHLPPPGRRGTKGTGEVWPVYGSEPASVLKRLEAARGADGTVNLSPRAVGRTLGAPTDDPGRAPEVLPALLWEWTKTTTPPGGEAPVEPYFSGIEAPRYYISVLWRVHVPNAGMRLWPRPSDSEAIDVPLGDVRESFGDEDVCRIGADGVTVDTVAVTDLRPGDRVVLPTDRGLLDEFCWNPSSPAPVVDASGQDLGLPLDAPAIERLCGLHLGPVVAAALGLVEDADEGETDQMLAIEAILDAVRNEPPPLGWEDEEWAGYTRVLTPSLLEPRDEVPRLPIRHPRRETYIDEFDEFSLGPAAVELDRHGSAVGRRAWTTGKTLGLPPNLLEVVALAGKLHDIGKADSRFQRWLSSEGRQGGKLLAKSDTPRHLWEAKRQRAGWPRGGRHEALSARLVRAWLERVPDWSEAIERDLLVHLVISHHGKGRPLVAPVADGTSTIVRGTVEGVAVDASADLGVTDWDQAARFRRLDAHLGAWGLALLEAIVIRADHAVSAGVQETGVLGDE